MRSERSSHCAFFRQHERVLHCHAAALAHGVEGRVRRVTNEDHAAPMPRVDFDPFDRPKMEPPTVFIAPR